MYFRGGNFDNEQLNILRKALDDACAQLGIGPDDTDARERIAGALIALGKAGQFDPERLRVYAVSRFEARVPFAK